MSDQLARELEALKRTLSNPSEEPIMLSYPVIEKITQNFGEEIGRGGFGVVYLGTLPGGRIAVKRLSGSQDLDDKLFIDEVNCLIKAQHENIVRFLGYCHDTQGQMMNLQGRFVLTEVRHRILCFEFVPNGNLYNYLQEKPSRDQWPYRYQMIKGICQGLNFLHEEMITHLDLKPENVMLDYQMKPKITDFGLSRCFDEGQSRVFTKNIRGTPGYIAPEAIDNGEISFKTDIFSLGIIIIKLLTGRNKYDLENWEDLLDVDGPEAKICIKIAQTCLHADQSKRPTIGEIIYELNGMPNAIKKTRSDTTSHGHQEASQSSSIPYFSAPLIRPMPHSPGLFRKESDQSQITQVEGKQEREELVEAENLFGEVIDNYRLDQMPQYMGKPKTQDDRAREALNRMDEDGKHVNASRYLPGLKSSPFYLTVPNTMCLVYNATGNTLYHIANHDWAGRICRPRYPKSIGNGQWAAFCHAPRTLASGSVAAVVYRGMNKDGNNHDYLLAWFTPIHPSFTQFTRVTNKAYCEIGGVDSFQASWSSVFEKMNSSGYSCVAQSDGFQIDSKIGEDRITPWFTATITSLTP